MLTKIMCMPYAGAGASVYRQWRDYPSEVIEVTPVQLPGREELFLDEFYPDMAAASAGTAAQVVALAGGAPFVLFGHSFGAALAFETTRRLTETGVPPNHLVVSGAASPATLASRIRVRGRADDQFTAELTDMIGYRHDAMDNPDLRELLLPILRADLAILEDYRPTNRDPLPVPITALRGTQDTVVSTEECAEWRPWTSAEFALRELAGGHMYFIDAWPRLWQTIEDTL